MNNLEGYETIVVYGGMRAISSNSSVEAFELILDSFLGVKNLFFPGFTPSFRKTGVYSVLFSKPEVGALSKFAHSTGARRTLDPIHSLFIMRGELKFNNILDDTFHPEGIYKSFTQQGSCIVNIGTPTIVSTNLHYSERLAKVPYLDTEVHHGVIYVPGKDVKKITHTSYKYKIPVAWNRKKIEKLWIENDCMVSGRWNGAGYRIIDGKKSAECLDKVIRRNPYFMVTF